MLLEQEPTIVDKKACRWLSKNCCIMIVERGELWTMVVDNSQELLTGCSKKKQQVVDQVVHF